MASNKKIISNLSSIKDRNSKGLKMPGVEQKKDNAVSGDLSQIVNAIKSDIKEINHDIDKTFKKVIFDNGYVENTLGKRDKVGIIDGIMSIMTFVSGGEDATTIKYSSLKQKIQSFSRNLNTSLENLNQVLSRPEKGMLVYMETNGQNQKSSSSNISLNDIKIEENSLKAIQGLTTALNNINNNKLNLNFNGVISNLSNLQIASKNINTKKLTEFLNSINSNVIPKIANIIEGLGKIDGKIKNSNKAISDVSSLIQSLPTLASIDKQSMKVLKKNLRSIYWMTTDSNILTNIGLTNKGIISAIIKNISERAKESNKEGFKSIGSLVVFISKLVELGQIDASRKQILNTQMALWSLLRIYNSKGPIRYLMDEIIELGNEIDKNDLIGRNSKLFLVDQFATGSIEIGKSIKFKDIFKSLLVANSSIEIAFAYRKAISQLTRIRIDSLKNLVGENGKLSIILDVIRRLAGNESTNEDLNGAMNTLWSINNIMVLASITNKISKGGINGLKKSLNFLNELDLLATHIVSMNDSAITDESVQENIRRSKDIVENVSKIAIYSSLSIPFMLLGKVSMKVTEMFIDSLKELLDDLQGKDGIIVPDNLVANIEKSEKLISDLSVISMMGATLGLIAPLSIVGFKAMSIATSSLIKLIEKLNTISIDDDLFERLKKVGIVVAIATGTLVLSAVIGKFILMNIDSVLGFTFALGTFILGVIGAYNLATKGMNEALKQTENVALLVYLSGATLLLGAAVMMIPGIFGNAMLFTLSLSAFIGSITFAYALASKHIENTIEISESFIKLVVKSGLILAFGAAVNKFLPTGSVIGFAFSLTMMIAGVIGAYTLASNKMKSTMPSAEEFALLIGIAGLTLLLPTIYMTKHPILFATAMLFAVELGMFVLLMKLAYSGGDFIANMIGAKLGVGQTTGKSIDDAKQFTILVGISGAILMLGAAFMNIDGMFLSAIGFTVTLGVFLLGISAAYLGAEKIINGTKGMAIAHEFTELVAISAATLLVGGLFMMIPNMKEATIVFAVTLGLFISGITIAYGFAGKIINEKSLFIGYALSALIGVSAVSLLVAGMLMMNNPGLDIAIWGFIGMEVVLVGGMAIILGLLSKVEGKLKEGTLALIGIIACVGLSGMAMKEIVKLRDMVGGNWAGIWATIGTTVAVLAVFAGGVIGLGSLTLATAGFGGAALAAGEAALAGIIGCVWLAGKAMQEIIKVMDMASKLDRIDTSIITDDIKSMLSIIWELKPFMNPLLDVMIVAAAGTVSSLGFMMSKLSQGIQDYANLSIPIYDDNGKVIGRRSLTDADFMSAAENIRNIITVIGGSVMDTYKDHKELFTNGTLGDFLGIDTPFTRVVKSCTGMGKMISKIAEGVKEMAELKIPIYKGTDKVGYRHLTDTDFNNAATNISKIVTTLGDAIIKVYNDAPEGMFDSGWLGNMIGVKTPFGRVVTGCTGLGKMISSIAKGVKDMAELRIPIYGSNGKQMGTRSMSGGDFEAAGENVKTIVTCLGNAILNLGNDPKTKWMFEDTSLVFKDGTCSRFAQIVTALRGIGSLISDTAKGVKDVADMRIQMYDEKGNILKGRFRSIKREELQKDGNVYKNVMAIMSCIPAAVMSVYDNHKEWFEDSGWFNNDGSTSPFAKVKYCLGGLGKIVSETVQSIKSILDLKLGQEEMDKLSLVIQSMMSSVPNAIMHATMDNTQENLKPLFENHEDNIKIISSSYDSYVKLLNSITSSYSEIFKLKSKFTKDESIHDLNKIVDAMLTQLPYSISRAISKMPKIEDKEFEQLSKQFLSYNNMLTTCIESYKVINKFKERLQKESKEQISSLVMSLSDMSKNMVKGISDTFEFLDISKLSKQLEMFEPVIKAYKENMDILFAIYKKAPKDTSRYENVMNAVKGLNVEMNNVKSSKEFAKEVKDLSLFTKSINSLDLSKTQTMSNLVMSLNMMASRLGGLDKLTNALANKLAVVLDKLVRELQISAKTIDKADQMQKKRHEAIKESISKISTLLNKPVEVNVKQVQQDPMGDDPTALQDTTNDASNQSDTSNLPDGGGNNDGYHEATGSVDNTSTSHKRYSQTSKSKNVKDHKTPNTNK